MGYMKHDAIICTGMPGSIEEVHALAAEIFADTTACVTPVTDRSMSTNGYVSFMIAPDGSHEGWPESDLADERRSVFIAALCQRERPVEWVHVQFGGDDGDTQTRVEAHHRRGSGRE